MRTLNLQIQQLEDRTNPGTITASFSHGSLLLTGSDSDDSITLSQPSPGVIQVVGDASTPIQNGVKGTTFPAGTPVTFGSNPINTIKSLTAKMGLGTDHITVDLSAKPINLAGSVNIDMGLGGTLANNQSFTVLGNGSASNPNFFAIEGSFSIRGGSGVDSYSLSEIATGRDFRVTDAGGLTPNLYVGSAPVLAPGDPLVPVGGNISISTGAGAEDLIGLVGLNVIGRTTISTGTGDPTTQTNATVEFGFGSGQMSSFSGGVRIRSAPNNKQADSISFDADSIVTIGGSGLSINTNGGKDVISINDVYNTGRTTISTGADDDQVSIDGPTQLARFIGPVSVNTGSGQDLVSIGGSGPVKFLSSVSVNMGNGNDMLNLAAGGAVSFEGISAILDGGSGTNQKTAPLGNVFGTAPVFRKFQ
jgi:hypothetical protein